MSDVFSSYCSHVLHGFIACIKQKTAYEMRISDWSSYVSSSELMPGVLLADDMGLGKTFQALMFLLWLRSKTPHPKPVLIVAPTGLLRNWQAELSQHIEGELMGPVVEAFGANRRNFRLMAGSDIHGRNPRLEVRSEDRSVGTMR